MKPLALLRSAYMSGPLTGVEHIGEIKEFYEGIGQVCAAAGIDLYLPHRVSDPLANPGLTPAEVYAMDRARIEAADLVVAYVGRPSLGVGCEIEIAREQAIPVVALCEEGARVSRMILGNPAVVAEVRFACYADGLQQLAAWLRQRC